MHIPVAILAPHVYLTQAVIEALFCDNYHLHKKAALSQPTQFSVLESVTLIGPRGRLIGVPVIGPARAQNQIEISETQARNIGVDALVRDSGDLAGTHGIVIAGPRTSVQVESGVICVRRHIHLDPDAAARLGLADTDRADICKENGNRLLFSDVLVHVSPDYRSEFHLNMTEANTTGLKSGDRVVLQPLANCIASDAGSG